MGDKVCGAGLSPERLTDRELLLIVYTKQEGFSEQFSNHLEHHHEYTKALTKLTVGAVLTGGVMFLVGLILTLIEFGFLR